MVKFNTAHLVAKAALAESVPHDLTWQRANQIDAFELPEGERIRGWIDKLSPGQISALQHPDDDDKRNALCNTLAEHCANGKLGRLKMFHNVDSPYDPLTVDYVGFVKAEHRYRISVRSIQGWFQDYREKEQPSEHILAWFAANAIDQDLEQTEAGKPPAKKVEYSKLATRQELIDAFGAFTGMSGGWFDNLKYTPALKVARKLKGQGGRGHIREPYFCPLEVMQWLINPKRKKGQALGESKGWELLENYFPTVYNANSAADPRPSAD